jgi:hypothetical protein
VGRSAGVGGGWGCGVAEGTASTLCVNVFNAKNTNYHSPKHSVFLRRTSEPATNTPRNKLCDTGKASEKK